MPLIALFFFLLLGARGLASCRLWSVMSRPKRKITMKGFRKGTFRHSYLHGDLADWQMLSGKVKVLFDGLGFTDLGFRV